MTDCPRKLIILHYSQVFCRNPSIALLQFFLQLKQDSWELTGEPRLSLDGSYYMTQVVLDVMEALGWYYAPIPKGRNADKTLTWHDVNHCFYRND